MDAHFVGKYNLTPDPSPKGEGSSLAVLQFVALIRGEWMVHKPANPFRAVSMTADERYCLRCCGVRWFDVVCGHRSAFSGQVEEVMAVCRCCGV